MALVPRDGSSRKSKPVGDGNKDFGNTIKLMSFRDFTIKENGKDRRIFDFLSHQLQSSWHPSFRYTTVVIRTLADCLYALSSQKRADMKFFWKVDNTELPGLNQQDLGDFTLREAVQNCLQLCFDTIQVLKNSMDIIADKSMELHRAEGPLNRLLSAISARKPSPSIIQGHVEQAFEAHDKILARQKESVKRWNDFTRYVCMIRSALDGQIKILNSVNNNHRNSCEEYEEDIRSAKAELCDLEETVMTVRNISQVALHDRDSLIKELRATDQEIRNIEDEIPLLESQLKELQDDLDTKRVELREDDICEQDRRARMEKASQQGLMGLMWSYYCGGSAEYQKRLKWDQEAEAKTWDLQEQEKVERKIQKRVGRLRYKLERLNLKKNQLGDGRIQKAEDLVSGNSARHDALLYKKMDEKRAWIRNLEAVVKNLRYEMSRMGEYEAVVPELRGHLEQMEKCALSTTTAYNHTLDKLQEYTSALKRINERLQKWSGRNMKEIVEDIMHLRYSYVVIQFMARTCNTVCENFYLEGLHDISHLGTAPSIDFRSSSRKIDHKTAQKDIDNLYVFGEKAVEGFDNIKVASARFFGEGMIAEGIAEQFNGAQKDCFFTLQRAIDAVATSLPPEALFPGTGGWPFRNRTAQRQKQEVVDWAMSGLRQDERICIIPELPSERVSETSELPRNRDDTSRRGRRPRISPHSQRRPLLDE